MAVDESWSEIAGGPLANTTSLFSHLEQGLRKSPHDAAVVCMHQPADHLSKMVPVEDEFWQRNSSPSIECLTLTYSQVHRAALLLAASMIANGVQPGSTILTLIPNGSEYSVLLWTCTIMRLTISSLDPSALDVSGNEKLWRLMEILKPGLIIVPDATGARVVDNAIEGLSLIKPLRILLDGEGNTSSDWKTMLALAADSPNCHIEEDALLEDARKDDPNRIHSIFFTSGTSAGQPKGCPQRTSSMTHVLHSQSWLMDTRGHNAAKLVLVQPHNSRAVAPALTLQTWREGATVVIPDAGSFAIRLTLDAINRQGVNFIVLTPAMVYALARELASSSSSPANLDSVSAVHLGGDTVTKDVLTKCAALFPTARVFLNHGMAEGGGFFTWPFFDTPVAQIPCFGEICPIGTVAPGTRLRIWDADRGTVMRRGGLGELHVCCRSIIQHYLGIASACSFYEDGKGRWFNTGDIGMIDDNGLVFILGRAKDVIKRGGAAIMPVVLESCIEKYTGAQVSISCPSPYCRLKPYTLLTAMPFKTSVVAVPHPALGHEPFAVLENLNGKSEEEIKEHVLHEFGENYVLRGAVSLKQIGLYKFPINATHKIIKFEVRTAVLEHIYWTLLNARD